jgi:hypothetical protein
MSELKGARKVLKRALRDAKAKAKAKAKTKTKTKTKPTAKNIAELRKRVAEENARQKKAKRPRIPVIDRTIDPKKISPSNYKNID